MNPTDRLMTERERTILLMRAAEELRQMGMDPEKIRRTFAPKRNSK